VAADRHLVSCLLKLNGLEEFSPFKKHLIEMRDKYRALNDTMSAESTFRQLQGRIQQINDLLEELEQASALASKIGAA
jgi:predicted component of type VI protein secretion system